MMSLSSYSFVVCSFEYIVSSPSDVLVHSSPSANGKNNKDAIASIDDVPEDALSANSLSQFHTHMRPYLWMEYPSATTAEINAIINRKWKALQAYRKDGMSFYE